jgi:hypothetical protein
MFAVNVATAGFGTKGGPEPANIEKIAACGSNATSSSHRLRGDS